MRDIVNLSRRQFLSTTLAGGGLLLGFIYFPVKTGRAAGPGDAPYTPGAFLRIDREGTVTMILNKSEMGQGVYTSLPMIMAEELECDWNKVRIEASGVAPIYNHTVFGSQVTGGSTSVSTEWDRMRKVGAAGREMLLSAAALTWGVNRSTCRAEKGVIYHESGKKLTYGELSAKAAFLPVPQKLKLKDPSAFTLIGKPTPRIDSPPKVKGKAIFGIDSRAEGMLVALVARPPVFGAKVRNFRDVRSRAVPGVKGVFQVDSGVAVVGESFWSAKLGRDLLEITWDEGPNAGLSTLGMSAQYSQLVQKSGMEARREGNPEKAFADKGLQLAAEYEVPYLAHAPMEPLNCLVDLKQQTCDIWTGTQMQTGDRDTAAKISGLKPEAVKVHTQYLGGGFGRRGNPYSDFVGEAVRVAKAAGKPVKVIWTREDDMKGGYYRPMWYDRLRAQLDGKGNLVAWHHTIAGQSIMEGTPFAEKMIKNGVDDASVEGAKEIPYEIPNLLVDLHSPKPGIPVQWWRSVGHSHTAFVVEGFIDEVAHKAGRDPYQFRRTLLSRHPRHRGVLDLAAEKAGWGSRLAEGRGRGIAMHESFGSFVAQVAEVSVNSDGTPRVHRVVCAIDCGRAVNPLTIEAQLESAVVFGLSAALHGAITFKNGRVEQSNFHDYPVLRMNEMPVVEVHIVPSTENPSGVGEPGTPPIAPAVANAIFAATGKRVRRLPIAAIDLKKV
ncbi:MAG TPA: xanthine dehydrogenase family protein molybdopterin-binding subunit [Syntrophorhabdaceae bacterium]|jgi:isoquinoline 1-oxidoreductase beta subunit